MTLVPSIPQVEAITYWQQKKHSKTRPGVFECQVVEGKRQPFVVKFRDQLKARILCEAFAAQLGRSMGLPVPDIAAVTISAALISVIPNRDIISLIGDDEGPHFGSLYKTGGFTVPPTGFTLHEGLHSLALQVFAFDMLIQNRDRCAVTEAGRGKPNILCNGETLILFDHEASLTFICGEPPQKPWALREQGWPRSHLFYGLLKQYAEEKGEAMGQVLSAHVGPMFWALNNLDAIAATIPDEWKSPSTLDKIMVHLKRIRDNAERFKRGIWEVLV